MSVTRDIHKINNYQIQKEIMLESLFETGISIAKSSETSSKDKAKFFETLKDRLQKKHFSAEEIFSILKKQSKDSCIAIEKNLLTLMDLYDLTAQDIHKISQENTSELTIGHLLHDEEEFQAYINLLEALHNNGIEQKEIAGLLDSKVAINQHTKIKSNILDIMSSLDQAYPIFYRLLKNNFLPESGYALLKQMMRFDYSKKKESFIDYILTLPDQEKSSIIQQALNDEKSSFGKLLKTSWVNAMPGFIRHARTKLSHAAQKIPAENKDPVNDMPIISQANILPKVTKFSLFNGNNEIVVTNIFDNIKIDDQYFAEKEPTQIRLSASN